MAIGSETTPTAVPASYTRKATGLVRQASLVEMIMVNGAAIQGTSLGLAVAFFFAAVAFPGANLILALLIAIVWSIGTWVSFALLAVAMPRPGGDYLYASRVISPAAGMASNLTLFAGTCVSLGAASGFYVANIGLGSAFGTIGSVTGNDWWLTAGETINKPDGQMLIALGVGAALTVISIWGTKRALRLMTILYAIAVGGLALAFIVMLFKSREGFISTINAFAGDGTYDKTVAAGKEAGLFPEGGGYSTKNTIGAIFTMTAITSAAFFSIYLAGEMKGAGQRRRQLFSTVGGGLFQGLVILVCGIVFLNTAGQEFFTSATAGNFPVANANYVNLFAAVSAGSDVIAVAIALAFIAVLPAFIYANLQMCQRAPFVWALDGLAPRWLTRVSDRTHTPVYSILFAFVVFAGGVVWARINENILVVLTYASLFTAVPMLICAICGMLLPYRRPDLYEGTPADWKVAGIPVIVVASAVAATLALFIIGIIIPFHTNLGIVHTWITYAAVGVALSCGAIWYYVARALQRRRGVEVELAYKTIPAE